MVERSPTSPYEVGVTPNGARVGTALAEAPSDSSLNPADNALDVWVGALQIPTDVTEE